MLYSLNKNVAVYGGLNRIQASLNYSGGEESGSYDQTNNVAQLGVILKAPITDNFGMYAKGAVGTKKTTVWEAGLDYNATKDLDINLGYRNVNTEVNVSGADDHNITFKGFITGISYRFGGSGHHEGVFPAITGTTMPEHRDALGIIESFSLAFMIRVADIALKAAAIQAIELRLGMGLGGKAYFTFTGNVGAVESAVKAVLTDAGENGLLVDTEVIPHPSKTFWATLF